MGRAGIPFVVWCGRFSTDDGYGVAARAHLKTMRAAGVSHVAIDTEELDVFGEVDDGRVVVERRGKLLRVRTVDARQEVVCVVHDRPDLYQRVGVQGRARRVGYSYFEASSLPRDWASAMTSMDEVWTSSEFNREVFVGGGVPAWMVRTLHLPVDVNRGLIGADRNDRWRDTTVFFTVVSGAQRRDLRLLFEAFSRAFDRDDPVLLSIKVRPGTAALVQEAFTSVMLADPGRRSGTWPAVEVIEADLTREQLHRLHAASDVYVSAERGDGWCLPAFDSIALERPVIAFDFGGSSEFIDPDDCYVVPTQPHLVHGRDSVPSPNPLYDEHLWPSVDPVDLAACFAEAAGSPAERRAKGKSAAKRLLDSMDCQAVARQLRSLLADYASSDFASNAPAVVEVVQKGTRWQESLGPHTAELMEHRLVALANDPDFLRPSSPKRWAAAYKQITSFAKAHHSQMAEESPLVEAVGAAMTTSVRRPLQKASRIAGLHTAARSRANDLGGAGYAREVAETMADYQRCINGQSSSYALDEAMERRRKVWSRFRGVRTPASDLQRLAELRGRHHGERIFIIGNGPSLNVMDLAPLAHEYTFGVNKIYLKFPELEWRPSFYTLLDWRMGPAVAGDLAGVSGMTRFYPERFRGMLPVTDDTYWYWPRNVGDAIAGQFAPNAVEGIPSRATVLVTAIQLAFHMGFRDIVLIGVDATYQIPPTVRQSGPDVFGTGTKLFLESTENDDANHFSPSYFGAGAKWHDPNVDDMKRMFTIMRKGVERHGGRLRNATVGGALESLERVDYERLFD